MVGFLLIPDGSYFLLPDGGKLQVQQDEIFDPVYGYSGTGLITWTLPAAGQLTTLLEGNEGDPVYSTTFTVTTGIGANLVDFIIIDGDPPEYFTLTNDEFSNTALFEIKPIVRELDEYIEEYQEPPNFTYDQDNKSGANYATYGSALDYSRIFTFTVRAYSTAEDSSGTFGIYEDRIFSVLVYNNYSSDRDRFIQRYFEGVGVEFEGDKYDDPEDFLVKIKEEGYYD